MDKSMARLFDPILVEVIRNELAAITEEMALTIQRTARSGMCKVGDFATAVFDAKGRLVAEGGSSYQMLVFVETVENMLAKHLGALRPGDIILANDPYMGVSHMPDITLVAPVFCKERIVGFLVSYSHHTDVGGRFPGGISSLCEESYEEGLRIPGIKLYKQGKRNDDLLELILANVRISEEWAGDIDAKVAGLWKGAEQFVKVVEKYGFEQYQATCDYLIESSEQLTREAIRKIPPGEYFEQMVFEDEKHVIGTAVAVGVKLIVKDGHVTIDLSDTPPQIKFSINSPLVSTRAMSRAQFKMIVPQDVIVNQGFMAPIDVVVPKGSILNPAFPAAVGGRASLMMTLAATVAKALAKAMPGQLGAGGEGADMLHFNCRDGDKDMSLMDVFFSGWSGRPQVDGVDGATPLAMSGYGTIPAEVLERDYPIVLEGFGFVPDSEGPGRHRGSLSIFRQWRFRQNASVMLRTLGVRGAEGLDGGGRGADAVNVLSKDGCETELPGQAHVHLHVSPGDRLLHKIRGLGGYGNPYERDPESVMHDVSEGKISLARARSVYGVVIDPQNLSLDRVQTEALRSQVRDTAAAGK